MFNNADRGQEKIVALHGREKAEGTSVRRDQVDVLVGLDRVTGDSLWSRCPRRTKGFTLVDIAVLVSLVEAWNEAAGTGRPPEHLVPEHLGIPEHVVKESLRRLEEAGVLRSSPIDADGRWRDDNGEINKFYDSCCYLPEPIFVAEDKEEQLKRLAEVAVECDEGWPPMGVGGAVRPASGLEERNA